MPLLLGLLASAPGFSPQMTGRLVLQQAERSTAPLMSEPVFSAETSRRAVLAGVAGAIIGVGASPVQAGYVTSLGIVTTSPSDAEVDDELLGTKAVKESIANLKGYKNAALSLDAQFAKNKDVPLIPTIRKYFDFSKLREYLNVVTTVFDDSTQPTIDRLSRAILYDLTELENASRFKKGEEQVRTAKKVENVDKWFKKLDGDFATLLAYFK
jgi:hypothetical protein